MDVKSAYLNALLDEEVYMLLPAGILKSGQENMVCKLKKALYGLKQAGREWQKTLTTVFTNELGFKWSAVNHSIFFRCRGKEHAIIAVAMDNMAVTSKHTSDITKFKKEIQEHFVISDGGELCWFLGFKIKRDQTTWTVSINQWSYIERMVEKFQLTNSKPVTTLMEPDACFSKDQSPSTPSQQFQM